MITHIIPSLGLALQSVKFNDCGQITKAWVVNGKWILRRNMDHWEALDNNDTVRHSWDIHHIDEKVLQCPKHLQTSHYDHVIAWAKQQVAKVTISGTAEHVWASNAPL